MADTHGATIVPETDPKPEPDPQQDPAPEDVDAIELREAQAAVKAEESEGQGSEQDGGQDGQQHAAEPGKGAQQQADTTPAPAAEQPQIPKARFDEVNSEKNDLLLQNARLVGQIEALRAVQQTVPPGPQGDTPAQPAEKSQEEKLAEVHAKMDAAATRFDNGEISAVQLGQEQRALADEERTIRDAAKPADPPAPQPQPAPQPAGDRLYLDQLTTQLEEKHPLVGHLSEMDFNQLTQRAVAELQAQGVSIEGDRGTLALRERIAVLSDTWGPVMLKSAGKTDEEIQKLMQPAAGAPAGGQPLSAEAQARMAKLELAGTMPPDFTRSGGGAGDGAPSDDQIATMSDEEISALPQGVRNKHLGIT